MKKIKFFKKFILIVLTKIQEILVKTRFVDAYLFVTALHLKVYSGHNLVDEAVKNSKVFKLVAERHMAMVLIKVFKKDKAVLNIKKILIIAFRNSLMRKARI